MFSDNGDLDQINDIVSNRVLEETKDITTVVFEKSVIEGVVLQHLNLLFSFNKKKKCDFNKFHILKGASVIIGGLAGVPYISAAKQYAGDNSTLGYFYASGAVIPFGTLTIWSLLNYIEYIRQDIYSKHKSKKCTLVLAIVPLSLATCAALPGTIISLNYNQNIVYSVVAFLNDFIAETCSYNILLRNIYNKTLEKYKHADHIRKIKDHIKKRLEIGIRVIISKSSDEINEFLERNKIMKYYIEDSVDCINSIDFIHETISESKTIILKRNNSLRAYNTLRNISYFLSAILPLMWGVTVFRLVKDELQEEIGVDSISWIIAALSSISIYFLEAYLTNFIFSKLYDFMLNIVSNSYKRSLSQKYYLKTTLAFKMLGLVVSGFSFGAKAEIVERSYSSIYRDIVLPFVIGSTILYTMSATFDFIPSFINTILEKFGKSEEKYLAKLVRIVNSFNIALENSSIEDFKQFLEDLDVDKLISENAEDIDFCNALEVYKETKNIIVDVENYGKQDDQIIDQYLKDTEIVADEPPDDNQSVTYLYDNLIEKHSLKKLTTVKESNTVKSRKFEI